MLVVSAGAASAAARAAGSTSSSAQLVQRRSTRAVRRCAPSTASLRCASTPVCSSAPSTTARRSPPALRLTRCPRAGLPPPRALARGHDERALWEDFVDVSGSACAAAECTVRLHFGVGVTRTAEGYVAVGVLAQLAKGEADDLAPARALSALNQNRRTRDAAALRPDLQLTRVAGDAAREFFTHPERDEREIMEHANRELDRFGLAYGRVTALAVARRRSARSRGARAGARSERARGGHRGRAR